MGLRKRAPQHGSSACREQFRCCSWFMLQVCKRIAHQDLRNCPQNSAFFEEGCGESSGDCSVSHTRVLFDCLYSRTLCTVTTRLQRACLAWPCLKFMLSCESA